MEQSFSFATIPGDGRLALTIDVTGHEQFAVREDGAGFHFSSELGGVRYGRATAIDADGERLRLDTRFDGDAIHIEVPASFVAGAAAPLVIDPLIGTESTVSDNSLQELHPDVTYDADTERWFYVWERIFSATDHDVYGIEYDNSNGAIAGTLASIDISVDTWERPKVANNNLAGRHLVVCQVSDSGSSPYRVEGRMVTAGNTSRTGNPFTIADASASGHFSGDKLGPDVGGDPLLVGPTYFTVVWEREFSATDSDIHAKQVTSDLDPSLRTAAPILIDNSTEHESNPSISNSNGEGPVSSQRWHIAYQRTFGSSDEDIRGATLTWDGQLASPANFTVDVASELDQNPSVSSPTDGAGRDERYVLYVYDRQLQGQPADRVIQGRMFDNNGTVRSSSTDLSALDGLPDPSWQPQHPAVDSDGCRFSVAWEELFGGSGSDWDTRVSTFDFAPGSGIPSAGVIDVSEAREAAGFSGSAERDAHIHARHAAGGERLRYGLAWVDDRGSDNDAIESQLYDGHAASGGFSTATGFGCGAVSISGSGTPAIGGSITVSLQGASGSAFQVWGQPSAPLTLCGGCQAAVVGYLVSDPASVAVPCMPALIGTTVAVQGGDLAGGPCSPLRLTDRLEIQLQ